MFASDVALLLFLLLVAFGAGLLAATFTAHGGYADRLRSHFGCLPALLGGALVFGLLAVVLILLLGFGASATQWLLLVGLPAVVIIAVGWFALRGPDLPYPPALGYGAGALALLAAVVVAALGVPGPDLGGPRLTPPLATDSRPTAPVPPLSPSPTTSPTATQGAGATITAEPTPPASPSPAQSPTATPSPRPSPSPSPAVTRTSFFDVLVEEGLLSEARVGEYLDDYMADPLRDHSHATGAAPGFTPDFVDISGHVGFSWMIDETTATAVDGLFPCTGNGDARFSVDCFGRMPMAAGTWVFVSVLTNAMLPIELPSDTNVTQGVVFDDDADPATGFKPDPAFPGDSYQGSTRWYERWRQGDRTFALATDASGDEFPERGRFQSQARMVTWTESVAGGSEFVLMVPAEEVGNFYRGIIFATRDAATYAPEDTSHDYTEADEPFRMHMLEAY